jgi:hypothetical protein
MNDPDTATYRCRSCGFTFELGQAEEAGPLIVAGAHDLAGIMRSRKSPALAHRSDPSVWSPLEYGCHVRDVLLVQRERVLAARRTDCPSFEPMGRDERVAHDGYAGQRGDDVARQLEDAAGLLANVLTRLGPPDWERRVVYNYPDRQERSLRWVATHTAHEVHHHLGDVERQLGPAAPAQPLPAE